ncbi:hypothetical protein BV22DRAFT_572614 [Leucogyrophana mollusca]|uniref:Uncharacterized protein n=1 Tax=Leucogyrophana mollusca TaxID=85980 RepID=A0ACB8BD01_9AGAM|nr:hypothetical protein BV22DRAFT_572614 [Leucogyrophana mollusca]
MWFASGPGRQSVDRRTRFCKYGNEDDPREPSPWSCQGTQSDRHLVVFGTLRYLVQSRYRCCYDHCSCNHTGLITPSDAGPLGASHSVAPVVTPSHTSSAATTCASRHVHEPRPLHTASHVHHILPLPIPCSTHPSDVPLHSASPSTRESPDPSLSAHWDLPKARR